MFVALSLVSAFKAQKGNLTKKQQEEVMEQLYSRILAPSTIGYTAQHLMFALCKITKLVFELGTIKDGRLSYRGEPLLANPGITTR